jgi:hypothetical protein
MLNVSCVSDAVLVFSLYYVKPYNNTVRQVLSLPVTEEKGEASGNEITCKTSQSW